MKVLSVPQIINQNMISASGELIRNNIRHVYFKYYRQTAIKINPAEILSMVSANLDS